MCQTIILGPNELTPSRREGAGVVIHSNCVDLANHAIHFMSVHLYKSD